MIALSRKIVFVVILMLLSAILGAEFSLPTAATSAENVVGVEVGDWAKYEIEAGWGSNVPDAEPPSDFTEINRTEWTKNTVVAISGSNITFERVTHYKDGNETMSVEYVDISTGESSAMGPLVFIPSDLTEGDVIHATPTEHYSINETTFRKYIGVTRETNHLNVSTIYDDPLANAVTAVTANYYWDRATGILCERPGAYTTYIEGAVTSVLITEKIVDTNLWIGQPDMPPVAEAGPDQTVIEDTIVSFDASASYDPDGTIVSYEWDYGDGTKGTGMTTTHTYTKTGTYVVMLTVSDSVNTCIDTMTVTVQEAPTPPVLGILIIVALPLLLLFLWRIKTKK